MPGMDGIESAAEDRQSQSYLSTLIRMLRK
jgi:hypothetical protein